MSTRGCTGWTFDGKKIVETYNHCDSCPNHLGRNMVKTLRALDLTCLESALTVIDHVDGESIATQEQAIKWRNFSMDEFDPFQDEKITYYRLLRDIQGADQFYQISQGFVDVALVSKGWMKDALFCEYSYVINFKTKALDCYKGYKKLKKVGSIPFDLIKQDHESAEKMLMSLYGEEVKEG